MQVREMARDRGDIFTLGGLTIQTGPVNHIPSSLAYRLEFDGRAAVYAGDTDWSEALIELARGADCLILEASNPFKVPGHLTPGEAGLLAAQAGVPVLILTHFYPPCDEVDMLAACRQDFGGEVMLAEDGQRLTI
jgi:ribonuclease BN (tRNA processing enzyme)